MMIDIDMLLAWGAAYKKLSAGEMSEADKKEFEKRINAYLKEIYRCISMLGE